MKVAPPSGLFSAQSRPPWASTIDLETARPNAHALFLGGHKGIEYLFGIFESLAIIGDLGNDLVLLRSKGSQQNLGCMCTLFSRLNRIRNQVDKYRWV